MNVQESQYYQLSKKQSLDDICLGLLRLHNSEYYSRIELKNLKDMAGKNYQSNEFSEIITPDTPVELLESKSILKSLSEYCNNKMVPIDYVKTMIIVLMNKGFMANHYRMLELRDDLYAYDDVKVSDLINNYYDQVNNELNSLAEDLFNKYPELKEKHHKTLYYFIQTQQGNEISLLKNTSTMWEFIYNNFAKDDQLILINTINKIRDIYSNKIVNPNLAELFKLFKFTEGKYRGKKDNAFKIFDGFISTKDYNKILANKYLMEDTPNE